MSYLCLSELDKDSTEFYFKALQYGHYLWLSGHAGRALLAITRSLYTNIRQNDPILKEWPIPYAAYKWIIANHTSDDFPGNPRISFQHQATRMRGKRQELRRARAWAVWAIIREARPNLPGDTTDRIDEPSHEAIETLLKEYGHDGEAALWKECL